MLLAVALNAPGNWILEVEGDLAFIAGGLRCIATTIVLHERENAASATAS